MAPPLHSAPEPSAPQVLICSGLDPSGGAGFISDVRVITALGCRPVGVVTALTVQNTTGVIESEALGADRIREQLEFLLSDVEVQAVKIGMIGSSAVAEAMAKAFALTAAPVVWDPIVQPSRGDVQFVDSLFGHATQALAPHVTVITPNASELAFLAGVSPAAVSGLDDAASVGHALAERLRTAVLVKGGHLAGGDASPDSVDLLCHAGGVERLPGPRTPGGEHVHGTGCALSSALAAHLARGLPLVDACRAAKAFVASCIAQPVRPGRGAAAVV